MSTVQQVKESSFGQIESMYLKSRIRHEAIKYAALALAGGMIMGAIIAFPAGIAVGNRFEAQTSNGQGQGGLQPVAIVENTAFPTKGVITAMPERTVLPTRTSTITPVRTNTPEATNTPESVVESIGTIFSRNLVVLDYPKNGDLAMDLEHSFFGEVPDELKDSMYLSLDELIKSGIATDLLAEGNANLNITEDEENGTTTIKIDFGADDAGEKLVRLKIEDNIEDNADLLSSLNEVEVKVGDLTIETSSEGGKIDPLIALVNYTEGRSSVNMDQYKLPFNLAEAVTLKSILKRSEWAQGVTTGIELQYVVTGDSMTIVITKD